MSQVSRYPMSKILKERMFDVFYQTLADLKTKREVETFLTDLLSTTEQVMLAKRLAIALLLVKGKTFYFIRDTLKVSTATILFVKSWLNLKGAGYREAIERIIRNEKFDSFLDHVEEFIEQVTLPRSGPNWSEVRKASW